jgi:glucosamine--fructose-6-phosphate aminotransferase (isomerizing)
MFLIAPAGFSLARARDTAAEGRRWGGTIYSVVTGDDATLDSLSDIVIRIAAVPEALAPLVYTIPVQLFAYHLAMAQFRAAEAANG